MNILIVRLGALGDIVHAVPAAAALRRAFPAARLDWVVEAKHRAIVDLVTAIDRVIAVDTSSLRGWTDAVRALRVTKYDLAIDLQGLLKSAVLARASGAARVVGFSIWHLREKTARPFYSDAHDAQADHVIRKNLRLLEALGVHDTEIAFPIAGTSPAALDALRVSIGSAPFALINPGAAWPNKRWLPERFGEVAAFLRDACGLTPVVVWGPGEEPLAHSVVASSGGGTVLAPPTGVADIITLARSAALVVSGDTGPLHLAMAAGARTVSVFGPTDPVRNGPFVPDDLAVSRYDACACHYERRCHHSEWCLSGLPASEVCAAVQQRLSARSARG